MKAIPQQWLAPSSFTPQVGFVRLWLEDDDNAVANCTNWGAISGLALSVLISAGCWAGLVLFVEKFWR
jgi:hypothetical protein